MARARRGLRGRAGPIGTLYTVGHGTLEPEAFTGLLRASTIDAIVDIRRFPGSRRYPHFAREAMEEWLPSAGLAYRWEESLGGRRRATPDSPNTALRNPSFRAYADYMETTAFRSALDRLLAEADERRTAVMCSESLWWRCHRRLVADAATLLHATSAVHLLHSGKAAPHVPTDGVRVDGESLVYDAGIAPLF